MKPKMTLWYTLTTMPTRSIYARSTQCGVQKPRVFVKPFTVKLMRSLSERSLWNWRLFSLTHQEYSGVVRIYLVTQVQQQSSSELISILIRISARVWVYLLTPRTHGRTHTRNRYFSSSTHALASGLHARLLVTEIMMKFWDFYSTRLLVCLSMEKYPP